MRLTFPVRTVRTGSSGPVATVIDQNTRRKSAVFGNCPLP